MKHAEHRSNNANSGFTLIEVMLVLMIMSGIMVVITQVLTAARTTRDTIHNVRETQLAGPAILDLLETDLRSMYLFGFDDASSLMVTDRVLSGLDADRIDFVTTTNGMVPYRVDGTRFARADVNEVGYCLRPNPDNNDFLEMYRRESFGVDDEPFVGGRYTFLHDRIVAFDIKVFDEDGIDAEELETWGVDGDESTGLPVRIEIELALELAPRLIREQLRVAPIHTRTVVHRRVIRFPEMLRESIQRKILLAIPVVNPPVIDNGPGGVDPSQAGRADTEIDDLGSGPDGEAIQAITGTGADTSSGDNQPDIGGLFGDG
ncbi:MAG: prepilin-type N-terminal cleavage/methylation domain-containing protein [Planctomycetota bacterium]|jgi:prepilin-type N-terminal cleavage/methylation domain-containing protein